MSRRGTRLDRRDELDPIFSAPLYELDGDSFKSKDRYGHLCSSTATYTRKGREFVAASSQYIDCGNNPVLFPTDIVAVEAYVNLDDVTTTCRVVSARGNVDINSGYFIVVETGVASFQLYIGGGFRSSGDVAISVDTPTHLFGLYDGATIYIFKNGVLGNSAARTGAIVQSGEKLAIGRDGARNASYVDGTIGLVRIYHRTPNPNEIMNRYLSAKWRCE